MVKLGDSNPVPIELGSAKRVIATHSKTSPGTFHFTMELEQPVLFKRFGGEVSILCTCKGFTNHRKCWHCDHIQIDEEDVE